MKTNRYINAAKDLTCARKHYLDEYRQNLIKLERQIDQELDDAMRDAQLPIEDEMLRIFEEQEEEVMRNLDKFVLTKSGFEVHQPSKYSYNLDSELRAKFLTVDSLLDFARWTGETAQRIGGYVRGTMQAGWCMGLALIGQDCIDKVLEEYVQEVIDVLAPMNENITRTSKKKIEEMVADAINENKDIETIKTEFFELFGSWKRTRPHGVSVFNVTYPFNNALFRLYYQRGIEFKQWVTQGDEKVRTEHELIDGTVVGLQETFLVGGARMLYPGDISVINTHPGMLHGCRCAIKPVLDPNAAG